jgi:hypothetical protein
MASVVVAVRCRPFNKREKERKVPAPQLPPSPFHSTLPIPSRYKQRDEQLRTFRVVHVSNKQGHHPVTTCTHCCYCCKNARAFVGDRCFATPTPPSCSHTLSARIKALLWSPTSCCVTKRCRCAEARARAHDCVVLFVLTIDMPRQSCDHAENKHIARA